MGRFSSALLSGAVAFFRLLAMFGINKMLAYLGGPTSILLLGQFQNLQQILSSLGTLGLSQAVIKLVAEEDSKDDISVFASLRWATIFTSLFFGAIVFAFSQPITQFIFDRDDYRIVVQILSLLLVFNSFNTITISFLNGQKQNKNWAYVNLVQVGMTLLVVSLGGLMFGTKGSLVGFSIAHMFSFGINYKILKKQPMLFCFNNLRDANWNIFKRSVSFSIFTVISLICVPLSIFVVRDAILEQNGEVYAGYWQGVYFLCTTFQALITTALSMHYLPTISEKRDTLTTQTEVYQTFSLAFLLSIFGHLILYTAREPAITFVYNSDFLPMSDLFLWQLVGNHFKICAWVFSYLLFSRDQLGWLIALEILFSLSFVALAKFFLINYGLDGANLAFAVNNFLYFGFVVFLTNKLRLLSETR